MRKQVFLVRLELVVAHFGPPKIPKCPENGLFWDKKMAQHRLKVGPFHLFLHSK